MRPSSIILLVTVFIVLIGFILINSPSSSSKLKTRKNINDEESSSNSPSHHHEEEIVTTTRKDLPKKRQITNHDDENESPLKQQQFSSPSSTTFEVTPIYNCDDENNNQVYTKHWSLVIGIPSVDRAVSLERRNRQRETWFKYSSIGKTILPRFLLGLHPTHNYQMSAALKDETHHTDDIIVFDLKEGRPNNKTVGGGGYWGLEAEVGMSRKAYFWYAFAAKNFHHADFIAKADDDLFLRANLISSILNEVMQISSSSNQDKTKKVKIFNLNSYFGEEQEQGDSTTTTTTTICPHNNLYWGRVMKWGAVKGDPKSKFPFVGGMFILMSQPLVQWIASSPIPAKNSQEPFPQDEFYQDDKIKKQITLKYKETSHDHEDVMVGKWLYRAKLPVCVVSDCRFHDVHVGANLGKVRPSSIGMHHLKVQEYSEFMKKYPDESDSEVVKSVTKDAIGKLILNAEDESKKKVLQKYAKMHYMC